MQEAPLVRVGKEYALTGEPEDGLLQSCGLGGREYRLGDRGPLFLEHRVRHPTENFQSLMGRWGARFGLEDDKLPDQGVERLKVADSAIDLGIVGPRPLAFHGPCKQVQVQGYSQQFPGGG